MTELLELPVPEHEEAIDDDPDFKEHQQQEDAEDAELAPLPDLQPGINPLEVLPDEGDDEQGDWDLPRPEDFLQHAAGMTTKQRVHARRIAVHAATIALHHAPVIHYTQGSKRWQGIADTRYSEKGQYPNYADCSAFVTWCLWNGLYLAYHKTDVVNGAHWHAGFTGTMLSHGKPVRHLSTVRWGDAVLYGTPGTTGKHTAIIAKLGRTPMVISHGSENGPFLLPYNYRSDIQSVRRYIHWKV